MEIILIGIIIFAVLIFKRKAINMNRKEKKDVMLVTKDKNKLHINDDNKIFLTFKTRLYKRWTLLEDRLLYGKKEISFQDIIFVKCKHESRIIEVRIDKRGKRKTLHLGFHEKDKENAYIALSYIEEKAILSIQHRKILTKNTIKNLKQEIGFQSDKIYRIERRLFLVDDTRKEFIIGDIEEGGLFNHTLYKFSDLLDFELNEDGKSIIKGTTTQHYSSWHGTGLHAGTSFSGDKIEVPKCTYLAVRILVNDMKNPQKLLTFIDRENMTSIKQQFEGVNDNENIAAYRDMPVPKNEDVYRHNINMAREIAAVLTVIQSQGVAQESSISTTTENKESKTSDQILEELKKFKQLSEYGIITLEEFEVKKKELLGL
jgi:hypothetical protein